MSAGVILFLPHFIKTYRSLVFLQTDSDVACEEAARLTAELQEEQSPDDDDDMCEYHDMPPPPDGG